MAELRQILPKPGPTAPAALVQQLRLGQHQLSPFDSRITTFVADLSRRLRRHPSVAAAPALGALAYWIRPASITRLEQDWDRLVDLEPSLVRVPRGLVFHLPPTNVDTLFVYSWLLSALCGNANVIRLSESAIAGSEALLDVVAQSLDEHPTVAASTALITYGHEREITGELSQSDVRVIWGGDETVAAIRSVPAAPYTREVAFPDRYSLSVLGAGAVSQLDDEGLAGLAHRFFNDAYWFDQLGCASPRLIIWLGDEETSRRGSGRFRDALRTQLQHQGHPPTPASATIAKLVHVADTAASGSVHSVDWADSSLTAASLSTLDRLERDSPGGGLFYEMQIESLDSLVPFIRRRDQTLTAFGVDRSALIDFVHAAGPRGVDRVVPVGEALTFGRYWDGIDLLVEFTRAVTIDCP